MTVFNVLTESGADYKIDMTNGFWYHRGYNMGRLAKFELSMLGAENLYAPWDHPEQWAHAEAPVVGRRMYLANWNNWRISTRVVSFTIEEEEEDNDTEI